MMMWLLTKKSTNSLTECMWPVKSINNDAITIDDTMMLFYMTTMMNMIVMMMMMFMFIVHVDDNLDKLSDRVHVAGGEHKVIRLVLLQHQPHT